MLGRPWVSMLVVATVAAAVRLPAVYGRPFWEDEVASAKILVQPSFIAMLHRVAQTESMPPLWYAVAWSVHQAGVPLQSERLLSVLFGALFAAAVVSLAHRFVALTLATAAGLTTARSARSSSCTARSFAPTSCSHSFRLRWDCVCSKCSSSSRRWDLVLAATVAAGCLTHYFFAFSVGAVLVWLWLDPGARRIRRRGTVAVLAGSVVSLPWLPMMMTQYRYGHFRWIGAFRWRSVDAVPLRLFTYAYSDLPMGGRSRSRR